MPKVSVIVPNYNHAAYLRQRLDSIFNQTFQDFEVILLDDASTYGSVEILKSYTKKYPKQVSHLVVNTKNSGSTFRQWKKGVDLAHGKYIWIAESDDVAEATFLEKLILVLDQTESLNVAICNIIQINEKGDPLERRTEYPAQELFFPSVLREKFSNGNYIFNASAAVFRKSALSQVDWNAVQQFTFTGDWLFWCMLLKHSGLGVFPETLCYHRYHENNVSHNAYKSGLFFEEGLSVYEWIRDNVGIPNEMPVYIRWKNKLSNSGFNVDLRTKLVKRLNAAFPHWWILDLKHAVSKQKERFRRNLLLQQRPSAS